MKPPKKIEVGPTLYVVKIDPDFLNAEAVNQGYLRGLYGLTDHHTCTIYLHEENSPPRQREVSMHEVLHVVTENCGIAGEYGRVKDEDIVSRMAPLLLDTLRRNPKYVDYWLGE